MEQNPTGGFLILEVQSRVAAGVVMTMAAYGIFRKFGCLILGSVYEESYYLGYYLRAPYFRISPDNPELT